MTTPQQCPCGCLDDMHIGEIGCPCGLPDNPPCNPTDPLITWFVDTLHYPFDITFDTPPPIDHQALADYWNTSDRWNITPAEALSCVLHEAGIDPSSTGLSTPQTPPTNDLVPPRPHLVPQPGDDVRIDLVPRPPTP